MAKEEMHLSTKDETGKRFSRLTVIRYIPKLRRNGSCCFLCKCDCGNTRIVVGANLRRGGVKSCGCLSVERACSLKLPTGVAAFNTFVRNLKKQAKKRGIEFNLTDEKIREITSQCCFYCDVPPMQKMRSCQGGVFLYNGMDRVDSKGGYTPDNIVPCCGRCNSMKRTLSIKEFETHIRVMYNTLTQRREEQNGMYAVPRHKNYTPTYGYRPLPGVLKW